MVQIPLLQWNLETTHNFSSLSFSQTLYWLSDEKNLQSKNLSQIVKWMCYVCVHINCQTTVVVKLSLMECHVTHTAWLFLLLLSFFYWLICWYLIHASHTEKSKDREEKNKVLSVTYLFLKGKHSCIKKNKQKKEKKHHTDCNNKKI